MLQNHIRGLEKNVRRKMKALQREAKKNRNKGNRKPSGFAVPTPISAELCDFMKRPHGSEVARTEVTQYIINYIKTNNLQFPQNRKVIKPDKSLKTLLGVPVNEEVTYFNLQRFMNRHFVKKNA
jgi:chromatin remodeling complex protein RSC6